MVGGRYAVSEPSGAHELTSAKAELACRFSVSDEASGNLDQVTPQEFEEIAQLYCDIRSGRSDIQFDTARLDAAETARMMRVAFEDLAQILQTNCGRTLLTALAQNQSLCGARRRVVVRFSRSPEDNECAHRGHQRGGWVFREAERRATTPGLGEDAYITYCPGHRRVLGGAEVQATGDTSLFHELVHALHFTRGTKMPDDLVMSSRYADPQAQPVSASDDGLRAEEYATAGLGLWATDYLTENQYRRERMWLGDAEIDLRTRYR
jgi:hypothetical protein